MRDVAAVMPRRQQWRELDAATHLWFVDDALDENDRDHNLIWKELQSIKKLLIGILVSTTTASLLLVANLATGSI